jgi:epoxyqueuosine reductase QueG
MDAVGDGYERLRQRALSMGASLFGVADLDRVRAETDLLDACYDRYTRGISIGVRLDEAVLADITDGPTRAYCSEYLKVNERLDAIAGTLTDELKSMGADVVRIPASEVVDWERLRGHVSHKLIGRYAGLGWIGKNILLVNPTYGAQVRYVTVLTDAALEADFPLDGECPGCRRCAEVCPAGAVADMPADFDLGACFSKLAEFNERLGEPHFICGICVKACRGDASGGVG